jgi:hypothetical protein
MGREDDPFDIEQLRADHPAQTAAASKPRARSKWKRRFVNVPWEWVEPLRLATSGSTHSLAQLLLYEHWHNGGRPIALSNVLAMLVKMPRRTKARALAELERLALVEVVRRRGRSPMVTLRDVGPCER